MECSFLSAAENQSLLTLDKLYLVIGTKEASAGYVVLLMGSFWGLELLPMGGMIIIKVDNLFNPGRERPLAR